jgi:hypothetical protein
MRTIPRNISLPLPPGERRVMCGCGFMWMRSDCRRNIEGIWECPDEQDGGRTATELNRLNQENGGRVSDLGRGPREPW